MLADGLIRGGTTTRQVRTEVVPTCFDLSEVDFGPERTGQLLPCCRFPEATEVRKVLGKPEVFRDFPTHLSPHEVGTLVPSLVRVDDEEPRPGLATKANVLDYYVIHVLALL